MFLCHPYNGSGFSDVPSDKRPSASQRRLAEQGSLPGELRLWALVSVGGRSLPKLDVAGSSPVARSLEDLPPLLTSVVAGRAGRHPAIGKRMSEVLR